MKTNSWSYNGLWPEIQPFLIAAPLINAHPTFQTKGWAAFQAKFEPGSQIPLVSAEKSRMPLVATPVNSEALAAPSSYSPVIQGPEYPAKGRVTRFPRFQELRPALQSQKSGHRHAPNGSEPTKEPNLRSQAIYVADVQRLVWSLSLPRHSGLQ